MKMAERTGVKVQHPLDPLTAEEIEAVGQILKRDRGLAESARFVYVTLREPAKDAVLRFRPGDAFEREAHVVLRERAECKTYEAVVSITAGEVRLYRELPGVQPAVMLEEFLADSLDLLRRQRVQRMPHLHPSALSHLHRLLPPAQAPSCLYANNVTIRARQPRPWSGW